MVTLDQTVKSGIKILENRAEKKIRSKIKNKTLLMWKDKKIISVKEWEKNNTKENQYEILNYIPDGFVEYPFIAFFTEDEKLIEKRRQWQKDYSEFLECKKNPSYGKAECWTCILNPESVVSSTSIRDLMLKWLQENHPDIKFPCDIVNFFKCPYEESTRKILFHLGYTWKVIHDALAFAQLRTSIDNSKSLEVDFEKENVYNYNCWSQEKVNPESLTILERFRTSKIPVDGIKDIYKILTNPKKLDKILDQYIKAVADNYDYGKRNHESEEQADMLRRYKKVVKAFFMDVKDKIKLEDLRSLNDITYEEEQKLPVEWSAPEVEPFQSISTDAMIKPGKCILCGEFANIHCINCKKSVCYEHWKEHGKSKHNMKLEKHLI